MSAISKNKSWSYLLVVLCSLIIFFQGCTDHKSIYKTVTITKVGSVSLENASTILNELYLTNKHQWYNDFRRYFDKEELSTNEYLARIRIENEYFLHFSFKSELPIHQLNMVLEPCDMKIEYDDAISYPVYALPIETSNNTTSHFDIVFRVETLKKLNYISIDENKQKKLCLFVRTLSTHTGGALKVEHEYITSNKLVYTAEELNSKIAEYESLTQ